MNVNRFNDWLALKITNGVATMWCAYFFAALALVSLPSAIAGGVSTLIQWIAQTFLQLVLLSIIMVGQKVQTAKTDAAVEQVERVVEKQDHTHRLLDALHRHHGIQAPEADDAAS